jgi:hypothetical protein
MNDETRWNPHYEPAAPPKRAPEPLWSLWVAGVTWSAQLRFHGESYGWEALILRNGELFASHGAFVTKAAAVQWAEEQRRGAEKGFLEDY